MDGKPTDLKALRGFARSFLCGVGRNQDPIFVRTVKVTVCKPIHPYGNSYTRMETYTVQAIGPTVRAGHDGAPPVRLRGLVPGPGTERFAGSIQADRVRRAGREGLWEVRSRGRGGLAGCASLSDLSPI